MLVINNAGLFGDRAGMSGAEKAVTAWLRDHDRPGIALSGCYIPDRHGRAYEADLVLITPETCAVVEVKGMGPGAAGTLKATANGIWTLDGDPAALHVRGGDTNPLDQVSGRVFDFKRVVEDSAGATGSFVSGLVLVVPSATAEVTLDKGPMPTGRDVLLGDGPGPLLDWLAATARRFTPVWTADLVLAVLEALDLADSVTREDLLDQGFPDAIEPPAPAPRPATPRPAGPVAPLPRPAASGGSPRPTRMNTDLGRTDSDFAAVAPVTSSWYVPSAPGDRADAGDRRESNSRSSRLPVLAAVAVVAWTALVGGGVWVVATRESPADSQQPQPASSVAEVPVVEITPEPPWGEIPATAHAPIPPPCYPLQPNC